MRWQRDGHRMGAAGPGMALPAPLAGEDTTTTVGSAPHSSGHSPPRVPQLTASPSLPGSLCVPPGSASCDSSQPLPGTWGQRARAELAVPALWAQLGHPGSERSKAERTGASTESETGTEEGRRERGERKDRKRKRGQEKTRTEKETGTLDRGGGREVSEHPRECPAATRSQCNTAQPRLGSAEASEDSEDQGSRTWWQLWWLPVALGPVGLGAGCPHGGWGGHPRGTTGPGPAQGRTATPWCFPAVTDRDHQNQ